MLFSDFDTGNLARMFFFRSSSSRVQDHEKGRYNLLGRTSNEEDSSDEDTICDSDESQSTTVRKPRDCPNTVVNLLFKAVILILAIYGFLSALRTIYDFTTTTISNTNTKSTSFPYTDPTDPTRPSCNCGSTLSEALSNNCSYDEPSASYLPPHCRDDALSTLFSQSGPGPNGTWTYYADHNGNIPLTVHDVSLLPLTGGHFYATHRWHVMHCVYYWRKLSRSRMLGTVMERRYDSEMHIGHCEGMFLRRDKLDTIVAEAGVSLHGDVLVVAKKHGKAHQHANEGEDGSDDVMDEGEHQHEHHRHHEGTKMDGISSDNSGY